MGHISAGVFMGFSSSHTSLRLELVFYILHHIPSAGITRGFFLLCHGSLLVY